MAEVSFPVLVSPVNAKEKTPDLSTGNDSTLNIRSRVPIQPLVSPDWFIILDAAVLRFILIVSSIALHTPRRKKKPYAINEILTQNFSYSWQWADLQNYTKIRTSNPKRSYMSIKVSVQRKTRCCKIERRITWWCELKVQKLKKIVETVSVQASLTKRSDARINGVTWSYEVQLYIKGSLENFPSC